MGTIAIRDFISAFVRFVLIIGNTVSAMLFMSFTVRVFSFEKNDAGIIIAETENDRAFYKDGALNVEKCDVKFALDEENKTITFTADSYIHAVEIEGNLILDDNYFSLLPNEERTVSYTKRDEDKALELSVQAYTLE